MMRLVLLMFTLILTGCDKDMSIGDLQAYLDEVKGKKNNQVEDKQLPISKEYDLSSDEYLDPFNSRYVLKESQNRYADLPLTHVPIEHLKVVGSVIEGEQIWAYVELPNGQVFKVEKGMPIGVNHGEVTEILANQIEVTERVFNRVGDFFKKTQVITTVRQSEKGS